MTGTTKHFVFFIFSIFLISFAEASNGDEIGLGDDVIHVVVKGDTLWDISETYLDDPYEVPPDTPPPRPPKPFSIRIAPPSCIAQATVKWIDAGRWEVSEDSFSISADMSGIIFEFGKGVYTAVIWAKISNESVVLSNYSVFVQ